MKLVWKKHDGMWVTKTSSPTTSVLNLGIFVWVLSDVETTIVVENPSRPTECGH